MLPLLCCIPDPKQRTDFTLLMKDIYNAAKPAGLEVTAAVRAAPSAAMDQYELSEVHKYVDLIIIIMLLQGPLQTQ